MVKALLLDLDGTLVESHEAHVKSYKDIFKKRGLSIGHADLKKHFGKTAEDILSNVFPELSRSVIEEIALEKKELFLKSIDLIKEKPCATRFIKKASSKYLLTIATSASRQEMKALLDKFSWTKYFKVMLTSYDVPKPKPAPDLLLRTSELLEVGVSDCLFIGDSIFDALSARNAGIRFIGVCTGSFSKEFFSNDGFESFRDLCDLLLLSKVLF